MREITTAIGFWRCDGCGNTAEVCYEDLANIGTPLCMEESCDNAECDMVLIKIMAVEENHET